MLAAIQLRKFQEERKENSRLSWEVRTLSQYAAAGYMLGKNQENKALRQAEMLAYDEIEAVLLGADMKKKDPHENGNGSYERFMGMVGALEIRGRQM